ncbi:hypothetical protein AC629_11595 [Bradyrhizobium sp. NAS80.1]|uniref:hypothetical protein n=1 Tax=Bradyrhizobium sp. NAS80.1 TaxID=1680159 RepID=UPI00095C4849|nr:hypothetical protein [Bradyrhizobium sp. NAS80.1]OKO87800.1 hypothetical protein AC629_11595 [Bradyrhizobium sp. NAS80.1]
MKNPAGEVPTGLIRQLAIICQLITPRAAVVLLNGLHRLADGRPQLGNLPPIRAFHPGYGVLTLPTGKTPHLVSSAAHENIPLYRNSEISYVSPIPAHP